MALTNSYRQNVVGGARPHARSELGSRESRIRRGIIKRAAKFGCLPDAKALGTLGQHNNMEQNRTMTTSLIGRYLS